MTADICLESHKHLHGCSAAHTLCSILRPAVLPQLHPEGISQQATSAACAEDVSLSRRLAAVVSLPVCESAAVVNGSRHSGFWPPKPFTDSGMSVALHTAMHEAMPGLGSCKMGHQSCYCTTIVEGQWQSLWFVLGPCAWLPSSAMSSCMPKVQESLMHA